MDTYQLLIHHPDGRRERTAAANARVIIGSGAHCDARLAADQAAFEHVVLNQADPAAPFVRALATQPTATLDGQPFTQAALGASAVLVIGGTRIEITRAAHVAVAKSSALGPAMIAKVAVIVVLFGAIAAITMKSNDAQATPPPPMPELFDKEAASCPKTDAVQAKAIADDQRLAGDAARERSPFDPREARLAVKSYELASACYRQVQSVQVADEAAQNAKRLREETVLDFRARRVRLERLMLVGDYELAAQDVAVLSALTEGTTSGYAQYLAGVTQTIKNNQGDKKK